jgi:hypothetical protein
MNLQSWFATTQISAVGSLNSQQFEKVTLTSDENASSVSYAVQKTGENESNTHEHSRKNSTKKAGNLQFNSMPLYVAMQSP